MKVLVYGLNYAPEFIGIGKYTTDLCDWLAARGHEVKVVSAYPYYPDWKLDSSYPWARYSCEWLGKVEIIRCPFFVPRNPTALRRILHHITFASSSAAAILWRSMRFRPDVLFTVVPSEFILPAALAAARLSGAKTWLHVQDFEIDSAFELGLLHGQGLRHFAKRVESTLLRRFDRVSTISPWMVERLAGELTGSSQTSELRNWVDTATIRPLDRMTPLRSELGLSERSIVALYAGSMAHKQGLEIVVEAARRLQDIRPHVEFVFCGQGPMRHSLVQQSKAEPNIRFIKLQPQDRLAELLSTADIHLLPQRAAVADLVLPSKLAPMLASGRPIIATAVPGTQLAIEVEGTGLIVPPDDPAALVTALTQLTDDLALRARLGAAGVLAARTLWDAQAILQRLEADLIQLVQERSLAPHGLLRGPSTKEASNQG